MSSEDARDFRRKFGYNVELDKTNERIKKARNNNQKERYTASKNTAKRAKSKKRNKKLRARISALLLAAGIGIGGISISGVLNKDDTRTITQMRELGLNINELGLKSDTMQLMQKYDKYFSEFEKEKKLDITDNDVIEIAKEIRTLNFNVIKDKIADSKNVQRDDISLNYSYDESDGEIYSTISIDGIKDTFTSANALPFEIGKENNIPKELADLIVQTGNYDSLISKLKEDEISKINAIKELEKLYNNISNIAIKEMIIDEKGNIDFINYDKQKDNNIMIEER